MLVGKTQADYIPVSIDSGAKNNSRLWNRVGECEALRKSSAQQSRRWLNKQTNKQTYPHPREEIIKAAWIGSCSHLLWEANSAVSPQTRKAHKWHLYITGENGLVRAVSQHMFDLSEKSSISTFINDHGTDMSWHGMRFDFRTICNPACQAMGRHQPAQALANIPCHRREKVREASAHFSYAGNLI